MTAPVPFTIQVGEDVLADLGQRLARVRWPDEPADAGWRYGTEVRFMRALVDHWRKGYDWRAAEARLNAFRQFSVPLAGIDVHFIHEPGVGPRPLPLLLSHGWPGSVWEFYKLIPRLTDPARFGADPADAFTVVAPSLPGYGFSFRPNQPRFGIVEIADVFAALMTGVLGYERFGAQGGDWGSCITARLGFAHRARLAGIHLNMVFVRPDRARTEWNAEERAYLAEGKRFMSEEAGYQRIQGTKPQTLAYALTDSPVGLAAWIVEKFRTWSDCGGDVEQRFTKDELLTNVMLYWVTGAIGSSFWPYYAFHHAAWVPSPAERVETPTGIADFPCEILRPPRAWAERAYDLRHWTTMPAGGHFAALEEPDALAADIRAFFRPLRA
ncbi:MAG: alpha/beta fold hydrolase [Candidatus Rokubacteria bacterium]|nr:alpha/beta fold hydrolase [Candidatus Rokubacteria bacterium]